MNVKGDIGNALWKRRAHKGDVILKRGPKGVLVLNESSGIWQITRETLRYANRLYVRDTRDYSTLPEHLRPPKELNLNEVPPEVLTTYAGLFLRSPRPLQGRCCDCSGGLQWRAGRTQSTLRGWSSQGR